MYGTCSFAADGTAHAALLLTVRSTDTFVQ